jgi:hypothetical protein
VRHTALAQLSIPKTGLQHGDQPDLELLEVHESYTYGLFLPEIGQISYEIITLVGTLVSINNPFISNQSIENKRVKYIYIISVF